MPARSIGASVNAGAWCANEAGLRDWMVKAQGDHLPVGGVFVGSPRWTRALTGQGGVVGVVADLSRTLGKDREQRALGNRRRLSGTAAR